MSRELADLPEVRGLAQAGVSEEELRRLASHPQAAQFILERLDDVNTLADPRLQESIRQATEEPESLIDITPSL